MGVYENSHINFSVPTIQFTNGLLVTMGELQSCNVTRPRKLGNSGRLACGDISKKVNKTWNYSVVQIPHQNFECASKEEMK